MKKPTVIIGLTAVVLLLPFAAPSRAQTYPVKPIHIVVPFSPGGSGDLIARLIGQQLTEALGQQVLVDNRAGAGGNIGVEMVARSAPDGYTLVLGHTGTFGVNPSLYPKLPFDPIKDFQTIMLYDKLPNMVAVHPSLPARSVQDLIALAKKSPGQLNYGSAGTGSAAHLATEYFMLLTKTKMRHIPYKGTGPAVIDLIAGQIALIITGVPPLLAQVNGGKLRALAVTSAHRLALLPELPTVIESGVPGYETSQWHGLLAPAGTPRAIVDILNNALVKALQRPAVKERLTAETLEPIGSTPEQFQEFIKAEIARWAQVVRASGARAD